MAIEGVTNIVDVPVTIIEEVGRLGGWLQALGIVVVIAIVFDVITFFLNRKKLKEIKNIGIKLDRIEKKIEVIRNNKR